MEDNKKAAALGVAALEQGILFISSTEGLVIGLLNGLSMDDLSAALAVIKTVPTLISGLTQIVPEYLELSDDERAQLVQFVSDNVKLPNNTSAQTFTQNALKALIGLSALISLFAKQPA